MNIIDRLVEIFSGFPGVGQRQAKRFVYFLLFQDKDFTKKLSEEIENLKKEVRVCQSCFRFFNSKISSQKEDTCSICDSKTREAESLMIVSSDTDLENIEKSGVFKGKYFVLGGILPILEKEPRKRIRIEELEDLVEKLGKEKILKELILAMSFNPEGENTAEFVRKNIEPLSKKYKFAVSSLGKGLSLGTELEYSDKETIKNALINRNQ